jgi:hypothetical protein
MYELQLNYYIFRCVFKSGLAMCGWNGHALLRAEYRNAAEEVCVPPAFVGDRCHSRWKEVPEQCSSSIFVCIKV